jgi:hypothetical protein
MSMLNNIVGYWAYILGALYLESNEVNVSTCGGLIFGGGPIVGGLQYSCI